MVRTADNVVRSARVAGGKSSRKGGNVTARETSSSGSPSGSSDKGGGGLNPICPRETPGWQRPITNFFIVQNKSVSQSNGKSKDEGPSSSKDTPDLNDVDMVVDSETTNVNHQNGDLMNEEITESKSTENKENENTNDAEMQEPSTNEIKKRNSRTVDDCIEEEAPRKKIKLDGNSYQNLREFEQM